MICSKTNQFFNICYSGAEQNPPKWGWVVVIASWIVMIPIAGSLTSFGIFLDSLCEEFNATKTETGKDCIKWMRSVLSIARLNISLHI